MFFLFVYQNDTVLNNGNINHIIGEKIMKKILAIFIALTMFA